MEFSPLFMTSQDYARLIRRHALQMVTEAKASHIGGALSMADILAVLYSGVLRCDPLDPTLPDRDRLILSKGHCCTALYAALALKGFMPLEELQTYAQNGSRLMSHVSHKVPGVEFSTGSLGHGLPFGVGKALAASRRGLGWKTYVILSDGELDEGSNWEAILFAGHHRLSNLVAVVDFNQIQSLGAVKDVLDLGDLGAKFREFGWAATVIDGHDHTALRGAFAQVEDRPLAVIARTVKGRGVSFMENQLGWHYRNPNRDQLDAAFKELGFKS